MDRYKNVHRWLLIPFVIVMLGFAPSYWLKFTDAPFRQHLHGLTATLWFILLIVQPYLATRGNLRAHRRFGMYALILAGGVALSGLGTIPYNLHNQALPEVARYGLSFVDVVLVAGFVVSVVMAIRTVKQTDDHARWMISTVFWVLAPATFRLYMFSFIFSGVSPTDGLFVAWLAAAGITNTVVLAGLMLIDRKLHPAWLLPAICNLVMVVPMNIGQWAWWRNIADALFTI